MPIVYTKKNKTFTLPAPQAPLYDTHAHLRSFWGKDKGMADVFARAYEAGVRSLVTLYDPVADRSEETPDARAFSAWLKAAVNCAAENGSPLAVRYLVGVHPYGAPEYTDALHAQVESALEDPLCVGAVSYTHLKASILAA